MNDSGKNEIDILGMYIIPESMEKAPEGFTGNIMARIRYEKAPRRIPGQTRFSLMVPAVSLITALTLIVLTIIFASPSDNTILSGLVKNFAKLNFSLSKIKIDPVSGFNIPSVLIYIAIGFFILTVFDRALKRVFQKNQ